MHGASGKLGNLVVFRQTADGETVVTTLPRRKAPPTPKELAERDKFRIAAAIAKKRAQDPVLKSQYLKKAKPGQGAYHVALTEYLNETRSGTAKRTKRRKPTPQPLTQEAYAEIANLSILAINNRLIDQRMATFIQNTLNNTPKPEVSKRKPETRHLKSNLTNPSPKSRLNNENLLQSDKVPRSPSFR